MDEKQSEIQRARQHRKIGIENYNRGIECQQRSDNNKAYEYFQRSINEFNERLNIYLRGTNKTAVSIAHNDLGVVYRTISRFQQAEDHYNLALEADPNNVKAKDNLQQLPAWQHHKIGIENYNRGIECQQRSDNNKAYEYFQRSINEFNVMLNILLRGTNKTAVSVAHNCIGCIYATVSRFQQAADNFILALEADPNNVAAKDNLQRVRLYYAQQVQQAAWDELQERQEQSNAIEEIMRLPGGPLAPWQPRPPF